MRFFLFLMFLFFYAALPAHAGEANIKNIELEAFDYQKFSQIPIAHEGRIRPLDSFAQSQFRLITGSHNPGGKPAIAWLALALFDPGQIAQEKIFLIKDKRIKHQMGLPEDGPDYYSLQDIKAPLEKGRKSAAALFEIPAAKLTAEQKKFLDIYNGAEILMQIMRSFSMLLPLDVDLPDIYKQKFPDNADIDFRELYNLDADLNARIQSIVTAKGDDPKNYSAQEQKIAYLGFQINVLREAGAKNSIFKIMPLDWQNTGMRQWDAPWQILLQGGGSPRNAQYLNQWQKMALSFRAGDMQGWDLAISGFQDMALEDHLYAPWRFSLERLYLTFQPYLIASLLYLGACGAFIIRWNKASLALTISGAAIHSSAIIARILILDRPPVGTLYESVLFVALICVVGGLIMKIRRGDNTLMLPGNLGAALLLMLAPLILPQGESLEILSAVLNTSFWLSTHVIIITAGYGFSILTAMAAHYMLWQQARCAEQKISYALLSSLSMLALLFTCVGTVLGGIWADQSWGRFWGWDPKENGALLIVLWLIWVQHGRMSGLLQGPLYAASLSCLNVIVALAWFGVNLLNVGLHSYGFTSGLATGLGIFCAAEISILLTLLFLIKRGAGDKTHAA